MIWGLCRNVIGFFSVLAETVARKSSTALYFFKMGLCLGLGADQRFAGTLEILRYVPTVIKLYPRQVAHF